jgi:hypothetical protein
MRAAGQADLQGSSEGTLIFCPKNGVHLIKRSTTREPEYRYARVEALKALSIQAPDAEVQLRSVTKTLDIERKSLSQPEWALLLDMPPVELLLHVQRGDDKSSSADLPKAVEAHKKYWTSTGDRSLDWDGFLAIPLLAVAALAYDRGFRFEVESEYIPVQLIRGESRLIEVEEEDEERIRKKLTTFDMATAFEEFGGKLVFSEHHSDDLDQVYEKDGDFIVVHHRVCGFRFSTRRCQGQAGATVVSPSIGVCASLRKKLKHRCIKGREGSVHQSGLTGIIRHIEPPRSPN